MLHTILRKLMSAMLSPPSAIGDRSNTCELISVPKEWSSEIISDTLVHHFIQDCGAKSPRDLWFTRQSNCGGSKTSVMQNMYTVYLLYIQFQVCRTFLVPHKFTILQAFLRLALTSPKYLQVSPFLTAYSFGYFLRVPAAAQTQQPGGFVHRELPLPCCSAQRCFYRYLRGCWETSSFDAHNL